MVEGPKQRQFADFVRGARKSCACGVGVLSS
jgi:hypothetical protein